jgi:FkbM family methyltransferase
MLNTFVMRVGRWIAGNNNGFIQRKILWYSSQLHRTGSNFNNFNIETNGEAWLVNRACMALPIKHIIDIGANHGEWLKLAIDNTSDAYIIACEPQPKLAALLTARYKDQPRVTILASAIGSSSGELDLHCYEGDDLANIFGWEHERKLGIIKIPVLNGLELVHAQGWDKIDLLKVDVEGMELAVLSGFKEMISHGKIGIVQFEFGAFSIQLRNILKDFYDLFGERYRIGRLMPNGIAFCDYDFKSETSEFANYVACRKDWLDALTV